mmetsp:Transcript_102761/g.314357  ORF Transcript_102761/g.314357 Transcript_102761/m.314357 type:complete len:275 (+) Transcript_102761:183-1007(+)
MASCVSKTSNKPSQARSKNSSWGVRCSMRISGSAMIIAGPLGFPAPPPPLSSAVIMTDPLQSRSPKARESASRPMTRPHVTKPPAASIRASSSARLGLWSSDSWTARPSRQSAARESPQLAHQTSPPTMHTTTAAQPHWRPSTISPLSTTLEKRVSASKKLCLRLSCMQWRTLVDWSRPPCEVIDSMRHRCRWCLTKSAHWRPPWPSYTANKELFRQCESAKSCTTMSWSSMEGRRPCSEHTPVLNRMTSNSRSPIRNMSCGCNQCLSLLSNFT